MGLEKLIKKLEKFSKIRLGLAPILGIALATQIFMNVSKLRAVSWHPGGQCFSAADGTSSVNALAECFRFPPKGDDYDFDYISSNTYYYGFSANNFSPWFDETDTAKIYITQQANGKTYTAKVRWNPHYFYTSVFTDIPPLHLGDPDNPVKNYSVSILYLKTTDNFVPLDSMLLWYKNYPDQKIEGEKIDSIGNINYYDTPDITWNLQKINYNWEHGDTFVIKIVKIKQGNMVDTVFKTEFEDVIDTTSWQAKYAIYNPSALDSSRYTVPFPTDTIYIDNYPPSITINDTIPNQTNTTGPFYTSTTTTDYSDNDGNNPIYVYHRLHYYVKQNSSIVERDSVVADSSKIIDANSSRHFYSFTITTTPPCSVFYYDKAIDTAGNIGYSDTLAFEVAGLGGEEDFKPDYEKKEKIERIKKIVKYNKLSRTPVTLYFPGTEGTYKVYDATGRKTLEGKLRHGKNKLPIKKQGVYFIIIRGAKREIYYVPKQDNQ